MRIGAFPLWIGSETGGIATYDAELLPAVTRLAPDHEFHIYNPSKEAIRLLDLETDNVRHHLLFPKSRWINVPISFPLAAAFSRLQLIHMTHVPPPISPKPYVMTLHCFSTFLHPEFYPRGLGLRMNSLTGRGLKSARVIICVSRGLRDLAESELKISPDRLAVAYNGVSKSFRPMPKAEAGKRVQQKYGLHQPYLLFVGGIAPRKNVVRILQAFSQWKKETGSEAKLALVGNKWFAQDVDEAMEKSNLATDVIQLGHLKNAQLPDLYCGAEMFIFPSLWESFGIPVMESMACGTPVLTSQGSCLPEIAGDAALLVDPYSVDAIAEGIYTIMRDTELANRVREKGLERAKQFTWENSALQTLAAYNQAMAL
jgi:glycosyltransferase involved in cell wall biosynthesis